MGRRHHHEGSYGCYCDPPCIGANVQHQKLTEKDSNRLQPPKKTPRRKKNDPKHTLSTLSSPLSAATPPPPPVDIQKLTEDLTAAAGSLSVTIPCVVAIAEHCVKSNKEADEMCPGQDPGLPKAIQWATDNMSPEQRVHVITMAKPLPLVIKFLGRSVTNGSCAWTGAEMSVLWFLGDDQGLRAELRTGRGAEKVSPYLQGRSLIATMAQAERLWEKVSRKKSERLLPGEGVFAVDS